MTTTVTDPMSREEVYKLSASQGVVTSHRDGRLRTETFGYDASGQLTQWVKPSGAKVEMIRDGRGNVTQTTFTPVSGSGQAAIVTTASYPSSCTNAVTCNQPDTTTDALGGVTNYSYDPVHGGVTKVVRPSPGGSAPRPETRYSYVTLTPSGTTDSIYRLGEARACPSGPTCSADKEVRTKYEYSNPNLYLTDVTNGSADETLKAKTHYNYDLVGNQTEIDGPLTDQVDVTFVAYNPDRSVRQVLGPDPDGAGPMKKRSIVLDRDANGAVTTTRYGTADANGGNFAELRSTVNQYDDYGRVLRTRMVKGGVARQVVDYSYNLAGQSLCTAIRMNPAAFGTSPADACVASTPGTYGADRISKSQYDDDGRTKSISNGVQTPLEQITQQMHYGAAGMVDSVKDAKLNTTSYSYDGFDRPSRTTYPDGSYEELTYDQGSRVTRKRTRDGNALTYGYDALGRVTSRGEPTSNYNPTATYAYDDFGQLTGVTATWPGSMTYTYDALGRMTSENHGWSGTIGWQYDVAGRRTRQTWPDNRFVTYEYLATGEMSAIREQGQPLLALFRYDDQGRRTSLERTNGTATAYAYDDANNEFSMAHDLAGTAQDIGYTLKYNPAGEIVSRATTNDAYGFAESVNVQRGYQANTLNQYTQSGSVTPTYDGNGNLTSAGPTNYRYTATGKLENASNEALVYDALDRIAHVSSEQTNFRYLDGEISTETAASGNGITRRYVTGPNGDEPLVWYEGADFNTRRWLYADERGSVVAVAGQDGTALAVNTYDEYGIPGSSNLGRFQYTGQAWLPSMQMSYYKARMYSPTLGRFLQPDPIGYGDGMNMYNYVGGNPVNRRDPLGLQTLPDGAETPVYGKRINDSWNWDSFFSGSFDVGIRLIERQPFEGYEPPPMPQMPNPTCIKPTDGPVIVTSLGGDAVGGTGGGISVSRFDIPSIGAKGIATTGSWLFGLGLSEGVTEQVYTNFGSFNGPGARIALDAGFFGVDFALSRNADIVGKGVSFGEGAGGYAGLTLTKIKSSNIPVCP